MAVLVSAADAVVTVADPATGSAAPAAPAVGLTPREREVLTLLADGLDVRQIASRMQVQVSTVRGYVKSLLGKFSVHSQLQAVVLASRAGLIGSSRNDSPSTPANP
jgi:DNA-binding NarL/FixJ family response regulator